MTNDTQWTDWIPHDGSEVCPIPWAKVGDYQIRFENGDIGNKGCRADYWNWGADELDGWRITAYRVRSDLAHRLTTAEPAGAPGSHAVRPVAEAAEEMAPDPRDAAMRQMAEALKPLAGIADAYDDAEDDSHQVWTDCDVIGGSLRLLLFRRARSALAAYRAATGQEAARPTVIDEIAAERRRQVEGEGFTPEHDDQWTHGELLQAAINYGAAAAITARIGARQFAAGPPGDGWVNSFEWPWDPEWWKPGTPRRMLIKAMALMVAEIKRIDRTTGQGG